MAISCTPPGPARLADSRLSIGSHYTEQYLSLALDGADTPHISYFYWNGSGWRQLRYAVRTADGWVLQVVDSAPWLGEFNSIAVDGAGMPIITYRDATRSEVKVARWSGASWEIQTVDASPWFYGSTSTVIDDDGNPHISYSDEDGGEVCLLVGISLGDPVLRQLCLAHFACPGCERGPANPLRLDVDCQQPQGYALDGDQWEPYTVDRVSQVGRHTALALDGSGNAHVSYTDYNRGELKYARQEGWVWDVQAIGQIGTAGGHTDLALDATGAPHISYYDGIDDDLNYARLTGSAWVTETIDSAGDVGAYTSLAARRCWPSPHQLL